MSQYSDWLKHYLFGEDLGPTDPQKKDLNDYDTSFNPGDNQVLVNWLYDSENWTDTDFQMFRILYNTSWGKNQIDRYYDRRSDEEYRNRYGIDGYGHDPRKWYSADNGVPYFSAGLNFVSKNVERLYR